MSEKQVNTGEKVVKRDENGRLMPGSYLNPAGKPLGTKHLSTALNDALLEIIQGDEKGRTYKQLLIERLIKKAIEKADPALAWGIFDRIEGKPDQGINMNVSSEIKQSSEDVMEIARRVSAELKKKKTNQ